MKELIDAILQGHVVHQPILDTVSDRYASAAMPDQGLARFLTPMTTDFTSYHFVEGQIYAVEVDGDPDAIRVTEVGESYHEPQPRYGNLEYQGAIGSGPWRRFKDWDSEADVAINAHHITEVSP